jgi:hypothetical protein
MTAKLFGNAIVFPNIENAILENNLYGVDINEESVEIARLSLWLRTAKPQRKLNSLNNNIKCGNSLISPQTPMTETNPKDLHVYSNDATHTTFDPEGVAQTLPFTDSINMRPVGSNNAFDKAFDWHKEFPQVFEKGGFDVVIGNPPYVPTEYISSNDKKYLEENYNSAFGRINLYPIFYERGLTLLKDKGLLGFITPYTILKNQYYKEARKYIIENAKLLELIDFKGISVFQDAAVDSIILILKKEFSKDYEFKQISYIISFEDQQYKTEYFDIKEILKKEDLSMLITENDNLIEKLKQNTIQLKEILNFNQGIITGGNSKFLTVEKSDLTEKIITGSDFNRYNLNYANQLIIYDAAKLHRPRKREIFEAKEKILLRQTSSYPICTIDTEQYFTLDTVHNGILINENFSLKYLLSLLNSKLIRFLYESSINESGKVFAQVKIIYVDPLPIKNISFAEQQPFITLADKMLSLNTDLQTKRQRFLKRLSDNLNYIPTTGHAPLFDTMDFKQFLEVLNKPTRGLAPLLKLKQQDEWEEYFDEYKAECRNFVGQIEATDKEIDGMVYALYGLTEEEIKIVENK